MATVTVTGTVRDPKGDAVLANGQVTFRLLTEPAVIVGTGHYVPVEFTTTTDVNGAFSVTLPVPTDATAAFQYLYKPPYGRQYRFNLSSGSATDIETLILDATAYTEPGALATHAGDDDAHHAPVTIASDPDGLLILSTQALTVNQVYLLLAGGTMTGNLNMGDNEIQRYKEGVVEASVSGSITLDWNAGNVFVYTLTGNIDVTMSNVTAGRGITVHFIQDGVGNHTITLNDTITWADGSAMTFSTTADYRDKVVFDSYDGVVIDGHSAGTNFS